MIQLRPGMVVHAKRVFLMDDNGNKYEYGVERGKAFTLLLMGDEDPKAPEIGSADEFLNKCGWKFRPEEE